MNQEQQKEITEVLSTFGLNQKDQHVYLVLLSMGQTTLTPLSNKTNLPVTTVQSVVGRLVKKGIVRVSKRKTRQVFEAHDPVIFKDLLKEQASGIAGILPFLQSLKTEAIVGARVHVYERQLISEILNASLKCKQKRVYEIVSAGPFQQIIGEKFHYTKRRVSEKIHLKSLRVRATEIKKYSARTHQKELREARFLPHELTFESSLLFWDDTVAILSTKPEGVHVMITSKSIREMCEQIFELLWSVSGTMQTLVENERTR